MEVLKTVLSRTPLLKVTGNVDHLSAQDLEECLQDSLRTDGPHLLLDLGQCPYLDNGGLSVLLQAVLEVRGKGWIGLVAPDSNLLRIFEITGLTADPHVRVFAGLDEAAAAVRSLASDALRLPDPWGSEGSSLFASPPTYLRSLTPAQPE